LQATKTYKDIPEKVSGGQLVIINLQKTQHDKKADASGGLVVNARSDDVWKLIMAKLQLDVPDFVREDRVVVTHTQYPKRKTASKGSSAWTEESRLPVAETEGSIATTPGEEDGSKCLIPLTKIAFLVSDIFLAGRIIDMSCRRRLCRRREWRNTVCRARPQHSWAQVPFADGVVR
jgi:hypothetical protein